MKQTGIKIIKKLRKTGYEAVFAGGPVRDMLMGNEPNDWDIATSALPKEVEKLFDRVIYIGKSKQCGTSYVIEDGFQFEVTTFRMDFDYDGRHPGKVKFVSMKEDALRRDITINGMFYDPIDDRVIDFVGGQNDIRNKIIRFIGKAEDRIKEDHLRMLRALRFSDRFNFPIEQKSFLAIRRNSYKTQNISRERIREELIKIFSKTNGTYFLHLMLDSFLVNYIIPEIKQMVGSKQDPIYHPEGDVYKHTELILNKLHKENVDYKVKLAGLFHDIGKPITFVIKCNELRFDFNYTNYGHAEIGAEMTELILRRLTFSNDEIDYICDLVRDHMKIREVKNMKKSTFRRLAGQPYFEDLLKLHHVDCMASNEDLTDYDIALKRLEEFKNEPVLPVPLIDGRDLIALGFQEGKEIGKVKKHLFDLQLEGHIETIGEGLLIAKEIYNERHRVPV